jgi:primosomal protein N' (replication factor Y)
MPPGRQDVPSEGAPYAQVLIQVEAKALDRKTFTYRIPPHLAEVVRIGTPVSVPFGTQPEVTALVVGFSHYVEDGIRVKDIGDVLDEEPLFDLNYLQWLDWVAEYYGTPLSQVIQCALPASLLKKTRRELQLVAGVAEETIPWTRLFPESERLARFLLERPNKTYSLQYLRSHLHFNRKTFTRAVSQLRQAGVAETLTEGASESRIQTLKLVRLVNPEAKTPRQQEILAKLQELLAEESAETIPLPKLLEVTGASASTVQRLESQGNVQIEAVPLVRDPVAYYQTVGRKTARPLSAEQAEAVREVQDAPDGERFWLYGVTGSGKTEVYLALTESALAAGRSALILVPEIALTSHLARRFIERFGRDNLALWHSNLSEGEKRDTWRRLRSGELRIVIGARSAIFAPLLNMGLIVMDEAHDGSFKQESPAPRYDARTLAADLSRRTGAKVVYGSATPDVSLFAKHQRRQPHRVLHLPGRFGGRDLAPVEVVDMRKERSAGVKGALSRALVQALTENLERQEQAILLINRRGFNTMVSCMECENVVKCVNCSVALTVHRAARRVRCHYCGHEEGIPLFCPQCASNHLQFLGTGSQRVEEELAEIFPEARIARLDSDVMTRKNAYREIIDDFSHGGADILVGTQMVAKGLDIANVTLVGVIGADSSHLMPDYKAAERGFQLLTQVAGRAGRGDKPGRVIFQSIDPEHNVIRLACAQDFDGFLRMETAIRGESDFPPYCQLFRFIVTGEEEFQVFHFAKAAVMNLQASLVDKELQDKVQVVGPAACLISRIQGRYRYHFMVKNRAGTPGHRELTHFYRNVTPPDTLHFLLDVDCQSLL